MPISVIFPEHKGYECIAYFGFKIKNLRIFASVQCQKKITGGKAR